MTGTASLHTFAIGDVHGRADLLEEMLSGIAGKARDETIRLPDRLPRRHHGPWAGEPQSAESRHPRRCATRPGSKPDTRQPRRPPSSDPRRDGPGRSGRSREPLARPRGSEAMLSYGLPLGQPSPQTRSAAGLETSACNACARAERYVELDHHILVHAGLKPGIPWPSRMRIR